MGTAGPQVRGERLIAKVLEATLEELAVSGYRALSFEVIADRASVNKTSIYRRWPTKAELVSTALRTLVDDLLVEPDEGAVKTDLVCFVGRFRDFAESARGRAIFRIRAAESENHELADLILAIKRSTRSVPYAIIERAIARGELPVGTDAELLVHCVVSPVLNWVQLESMHIDDARIGTVVDLVLRGALHGAAVGAQNERSPTSLEAGLSPCIRVGDAE